MIALVSLVGLAQATIGYGRPDYYVQQTNLPYYATPVPQYPSSTPCDTPTAVPVISTPCATPTITTPCETPTVVPVISTPCATPTVVPYISTPCDTPTAVPTITTPCETPTVVPQITTPCETPTVVPAFTTPCETPTAVPYPEVYPTATPLDYRTALPYGSTALPVPVSPQGYDYVPKKKCVHKNYSNVVFPTATPAMQYGDNIYGTPGVQNTALPFLNTPGNGMTSTPCATPTITPGGFTPTAMPFVTTTALPFMTAPGYVATATPGTQGYGSPASGYGGNVMPILAGAQSDFVSVAAVAIAIVLAL